MQASGLAYKIAFSLLRGMNATTAGEMLRRLGSPEEFFRLDARSLRSRMGVKSDLADSEYRSSLLEIAVSEAEFIADMYAHASLPTKTIRAASGSAPMRL